MNGKIIFIASSGESMHYAKAVKNFLFSKGVIPLLWNDPNVFTLGGLTFESIESVASQIHGAVIIASPDIRAESRRGVEIIPRPNVLLELGFFVGRLSRKQIAFCLFDGVSKPTDLTDFTHLPLGKFLPKKLLNKSVGVRLNERSRKVLSNWIERLDVTPQQEPRTTKCHGYSGLWETEMVVPNWRRIEIKKPDKVVIIGKFLFHIPHEGHHGTGVFYGTVHVRLRKKGMREACNRTFRVVDRVDNVTCAKDGTLTFTSETVSRELLETGEGPVPSEGLSSNRTDPWTYDWQLIPVDSGEWQFEGEFNIKGSTSESRGQVFMRRE